MGKHQCSRNCQAYYENDVKNTPEYSWIAKKLYNVTVYYIVQDKFESKSLPIFGLKKYANISGLEIDIQKASLTHRW